MQKIKSAFTLVELIVVITILAILWTIAFLAMQGYSANARDWVRTTDLANISKSLELYSLKTWNYPFPSTSVDITYSGWLAWKQWTFWTEPFNQVWNINKLPTDPLTWNEYTYSVTESKWEFQVAGVYEWSLSKNKDIVNKSYANWNISWLAKVTWTYNWVTLSVLSWATTFILAVPTIISWDISLLDLQTIVNNKKLVYSWFKNLPASYSGSQFKINNTSFNFIPNPLIVYSWNLNTLKTSEPTRIQLLKDIQTAYSWTILASDTNISWILAIPTNTVTPSSQTKTLASSILKNNLGISNIEVVSSNTPTWNTQPVCNNPTYIGSILWTTWSNPMGITIDSTWNIYTNNASSNNRVVVPL